MARGGGGSRGGGSRGGGFGGSRGSGGRSGGFGGGSSRGRSGGLSGGFSGRSGRSSGSRPSSPFGSGHRPSGGYFRPSRPVFFFGGGHRSNRYYGPGNSGCGASGCSTTIFIGIIMFIIILVVISSILSPGASYNITKSTIERKPLPVGSANETEYYTDKIGWIGNRTKLLTGMKNFYDKTGVQPHLYITDAINGAHYPTAPELADFADNTYEELFTDEAHILLVFFEFENEYMTRYVTGVQAKTVIDDEAGDILLDYLDRYYYDNGLTDEEYFSKSFNDAAERIMQVYRPPWISVGIMAGILIVVLVLFFWWKKAKDQKNKEAEMNEKILNTPLEQFGDTEAEELGKKYED